MWLSTGARQQLASEQVDLLRAIAATGSISAAGRALGISYKTAWDRVENLNNMSTQALVVRSSGGAGGGGTRLTPQGKNILEGFDALQQIHDRFISELGRQISSVEELGNFMSNSLIRSSAGNQFLGTVLQILEGAVNCEVSLQISQTQNIIAMISARSREQLQLEPGSTVVAIINPASVILSLDTTVRSSARNALVAPLLRVRHGAVNSEVALDLGDGKTLLVSLSRHSAEAMELKQGQTVAALFKASSVILISGGVSSHVPA